MANSVSLSTDMEKLLFTNASGTSEIDLNGDGAILQISGGEITAEAAAEPLSGSGIIESTVDAQWTLTFNTATSYAFFIGIEDVDINKTAKGHDFELTGKKLNVRKAGISLIVVLK